MAGLGQECVVCLETVHPVDLVTLPCGDHYCRQCLNDRFDSAAMSEANFPPACAHGPIELASVRIFLLHSVVRAYESIQEEFSTPNRVYCYESTCSAWISPTHIHNNVATCVACSKTTCAYCRAKLHEDESECPDDPAVQTLMATAQQEGYQQCSQCRRLIERTAGCNHIICKLHLQIILADICVPAVKSSATNVASDGGLAIAPCSMKLSYPQHNGLWTKGRNADSKLIDPHAHIPEEVRQALEDDLWEAFDEAADRGEFNVQRIQHILGPVVGPQVAAMWDLPALVENLRLHFAPDGAEPRPQHPERVELPLRPHPNPPVPARVAVFPDPDWIRPPANPDRVNDIVQARIGARRRAGEDEGQLNRPQRADRMDIADLLPQANEPRRPEAVRVPVPGPAALEAIGERMRHAREMDGAARRLQGLHLGREQQHIRAAIDDPGEGRAGAQDREADVARQIQALENRFLADGPPEGFEIRDGQLAANDRVINERPLNPHPIVQRPQPPRPHQAALPPVAPIVLPPGHNEWGLELNCPHQQWRKDNQANQECHGCHQVQANYTLVCNLCAARRCKRCKRRMAAGRW